MLEIRPCLFHFFISLFQSQYKARGARATRYIWAKTTQARQNVRTKNSPTPPWSAVAGSGVCGISPNSSGRIFEKSFFFHVFFVFAWFHSVPRNWISGCPKFAFFQVRTPTLRQFLHEALLVHQSRLGDRLLETGLDCPRNGTAALEGLRYTTAAAHYL